MTKQTNKQAMKQEARKAMRIYDVEWCEDCGLVHGAALGVVVQSKHTCYCEVQS